MMGARVNHEGLQVEQHNERHMQRRLRTESILQQKRAPTQAMVQAIPATRNPNRLVGQVQ